MEAVYKGTHAEVYVEVAGIAPLLVRWREDPKRTIEDVAHWRHGPSEHRPGSHPAI